MDKEEFRIKLEEINELVNKKDYKGAMEIVDSIDWRRVKNARTLCVVGEIYAANKRYEDSKEIFLLAYHRSPIGKNILYRLIEVSIKMGDLEEAQEFYEEYLEVASNDNTRFILHYKIESAKKAPIEQLIGILEEYKSHEYTERWSYELAKLYYKAGNKEKCAETCDDMILWFSDGKYVTKCLDLKMRLGILTPAQKRKYEEALIPKLRSKKEIKAAKEKEEEKEYEEARIDNIPIPPKEKEEGGGGILEATGLFQEKITKGIKDIFSGKRKEEPLTFEEEEDKEKEQKKEEQEESKEEDIQTMLNDHTSMDDVPSLEPEQPAVKTEYSKEPEELKMPESIKISKPVEAPKVEATPAFVPSQEEIAAALEADEKQKEEWEKRRAEEAILQEAQREEEKAEVQTEEEKAEAETEEEKAEAEEIEENREEQAEETEKQEENTISAFNLEDRILAAASAQGIPISSEEEVDPVKEQEAERMEEEASAEEVPVHEEVCETEEIPALEEEVIETKEEALEEKIQEDTAPIEVEKEAPALSEEDLLEQFIDKLNQEPEKEGMYLIPREMKLDDEEKKIFSYFSSIPGIPDQLVDALADVQQSMADKTSKTGNVIIMGALETGKTRLSQGFVLAACRELQMEAAKVATVSGQLLNEKEPVEVVNTLAGGFLIIEKAAQMTAETIDKLNQAMEFRTDGLTVIIEDEKIGMRKLIAKYPKFAGKFTSMINIPVFTNDELVSFAKVYTKENGYVMDQLGVLALYNLIGDNQKEDEPMTIGKVKEMVDDAINRAESSTRKFKRNLSNKRVDEEGRVILYEKDFG